MSRPASGGVRRIGGGKQERGIPAAQESIHRKIDDLPSRKMWGLVAVAVTILSGAIHFIYHIILIAPALAHVAK